ncbi:MAG: MerR family transcriptional regulator [bacterium]
MDKSPEAFRTISEVAETLETPAHVLRFWESRFPQIKPVKRAGGRRYYRPADVALLGGIRHLLHDEGMTIRGVQKILREQGVRHVAALVAGGAETSFDQDADQEAMDLPSRDAAEEAATDRVVAFDSVVRRMAVPTDSSAEVVDLHAPADEDTTPEKVDPEAEDDKALDMPVRLGALSRPYPIDETVPEAEHIFVDDYAEMPNDDPVPIFNTPADAAEAEDSAAPVRIAARLRALPRPVSEAATDRLTDLHSRLGLLHAQIVEVQRPRR